MSVSMRSRFGPKRGRAADAEAEACASGKCMDIVVTRNKDGSCWADSSLSILTYPEASRAVLERCVARVEARLHARERHTATGLTYYEDAFRTVARTLRTILSATGGEGGWHFDSCPGQSPARTLYNALTRAYELPSLPTPVAMAVGLVIGNKGGHPTKMITAVNAFVNKEMGREAFALVPVGVAEPLQSAVRSRPEATVVFLETHVGGRSVPMEVGDSLLQGATMVLTGQSNPHALSVVRCRHDPTIWEFNDSMGMRTLGDVDGWSREHRLGGFAQTFVSFSLEDYDPFRPADQNVWNLIYNVRSVVNVHSTQSVLVYMRKDLTTAVRRRAAAVDEGTCHKGSCLRMHIDVASDVVAWSDLATAFAQHSLGTPPVGDASTIRDLASATATGATRKLSVGVATTGNLHSVSRCCHSVVLHRPAGSNRVVFSEIEDSHKAVAAIVSLGDRQVLLLRCKEDGAHWTVFCTGSKPDGNRKNGGVSFVMRYMDLFDQHGSLDFVSLAVGGKNLKINRGMYECAVVYACNPEWTPHVNRGVSRTLPRHKEEEEETGSVEYVMSLVNTISSPEELKRCVMAVKHSMYSAAFESQYGYIAMKLLIAYSSYGFISVETARFLAGTMFAPVSSLRVALLLYRHYASGLTGAALSARNVAAELASVKRMIQDAIMEGYLQFSEEEEATEDDNT